MKFTIRDLFLVTVILALAAGWWVMGHYGPDQMLGKGTGFNRVAS